MLKHVERKWWWARVKVGRSSPSQTAAVCQQILHGHKHTPTSRQPWSTVYQGQHRNKWQFYSSSFQYDVVLMKDRQCFGNLKNQHTSIFIGSCPDDTVLFTLQQLTSVLPWKHCPWEDTSVLALRALELLCWGSSYLFWNSVCKDVFKYLSSVALNNNI